ncbi:MAG: gliding motility-associated C-terminal domain-containing protein [Flavobacteriales bacterium]
MPFFKSNTSILFALILLGYSLLGNTNVKVNVNTNARFIQNNGQWPQQVLFAATMGYGTVFIEKDALTFNVHDAQKMHEYYESSHGEGNAPLGEINAHNFKIKFKNTLNASAEGRFPYLDYVNYFIGDDSSKWASRVPVFREVFLHNIYQGIDLHLYEYKGHLKYDFIVQPKANASQIYFECEGIETSLNNGEIIMASSIGNFIQEAPYTYQRSEDGNKISVDCSYSCLEKNQYHFNSKNYNDNLPLVIDPVIVFASFSGSIADNRGFSATYDNAGFLYIGGIAYGSGYITTSGAYKINYNGGIDDIVISKYSADGSSFIYSTHLGGTGCEEPHSLVVDQNFQLSVFGTTGSSDFPTTPGAYDNTFNGGSYRRLNHYLEFPNGVDIFVTKFNANGSALVGSTFIGGSGTDGLNDETFSSGMSYNYGDWFRGEIISDDNGSLVVVTSTSSHDFPMVGAFQPAFAGGGHDAVVLKLNNNLSSLVFSSFLGGNDNDAAYSVQFDNKNDLYITGGTKSSNFPVTAGVLHNTIQGGVDGFITHISGNGNLIKASTYIGTSSFDQTYFVQLDNNNNVFVLGQTQGNYPVTSGVYSNSNSKHFIHKLNSSLTTTVFSSIFGANSNLMQMSPTAFLVSECEDIYVSGWGGKTNINVQNDNYPNEGTLFTSMAGMPISADAFQSNTDGNDFYFAVFSKDMKSLKYGTYMGGASVDEHVDGGTSRFDKKGNIYQAVCGGCYGSSDFPVTAGVWSTTNKATNQAQCNEVGIKFSASKLSAVINGLADSILCVNETNHFINKSDGATSFLWDFGNGEVSTEKNPSYTYKETGRYKISLVAINASGCPPTDTTFINVNVVMPITVQASSDTVCEGKSVTLIASGANTYQWTPSTTLNQKTGAIVIATPTENTTYTVNTDSYCNNKSASVTVTIASTEHTITPADSVCPNTAFPLSVGPGKNFSWSPSHYFNNATSNSPTVHIDKSTTLHVSFFTDFGCLVHDSVYLKVLPVPNFTLSKDTLICFGESTPLNFSLNENYSYSWSPSSSLNQSNVKTPIATPLQNTKYTASIANKCGTTDLFYNVNVSKVQSNVSANATLCKGDTMELWAKGGIEYAWSPSNTLSDSTIANPFAFPLENTSYKVVITNEDQCSDSAYTTLILAENNIRGLNPQYVVEYGDDVKINTDAQNISWSPSTYLSCNTCSSPIVQLPEQDITYHYLMYDELGCPFKDSVKVYVIRKVYVPNAFTPNNDGLNEAFYFRSISVAEFELLIFNRWGELIFTSNNINQGWDGTYNGREAQIDVYVWKVRYKREHTSIWEEEIGRVSLIR